VVQFGLRIALLFGKRAPLDNRLVTPVYNSQYESGLDEVQKTPEFPGRRRLVTPVRN